MTTMTSQLPDDEVLRGEYFAQIGVLRLVVLAVPGVVGDWQGDVVALLTGPLAVGPVGVLEGCVVTINPDVMIAMIATTLYHYEFVGYIKVS